MALGILVGGPADGNLTIVAGNGEPVIVDGDGAGALRVGVLGEGGGTSSDTLSTVGDLGGLHVLAVLRVPEHDLVVVTGGHDSAIGHLVKTPDLTIGVGVHDGASDGTVGSDVDGTVTGANNELGAVEVDGTDEGVHIDSHCTGSGGGIPAVELVVFATGEHLAGSEAHGTDEFTLGAGEDSLTGAAIIATPDVDGAVGTTRPGLALIVVGATSEAGHGLSAEKTLLLVSSLRLGVPEVDVLDTGGAELLGVVVPADVVDLVGITLLLPDTVASLVEDVDLVFVVEIHSGDPAVLGDAHGSDTTGTLSDLDSLHLLSSACVPLEDSGGGTVLSGDSDLALVADGDREDVIGVMVRVSGDVLGGHVDFTGSEELLGVGVAVKDNAEGGSHVDSLTVAVPVDVLLGVSASVAVDVLKSVGAVGSVSNEWVVVVGLGDLTNPGAECHELFTLSLLDLEEIVLGTVVVLAFAASFVRA